MNHEHHIHTGEATPLEYLKFAGVILGIFLTAYIYEYQIGFDSQDFMRVFMGVFFLVFAGFKLLDLSGFVSSYIGYDIIAKRFTSYAYAYPFIEAFLGFAYLFDYQYANHITLPLMIIGSIGVGRELMRGSKIKCACLGTYIKLPLTTVSLVEDLSMGLMALILVWSL